MPTSVKFTKRLIDIILSLFILVVFSPLLIVVSILIKLDSKGPVFFLQKRAKLAKYPTPSLPYDTFNMIKFRTMVDKASDHNGDNSVENDPRITRVGRFLRKTRLDEVPNLLNVILGQMSIVGPRADRAVAMEEVLYEFPLVFNRIIYCKPGITGLSQVKLRSNGDMNGNTELPRVLPEHDKDEPVLSFRYKMYYDFAYHMRLTNFWSFLKTDIMVLLKTPIVMFFKHNTI